MSDTSSIQVSEVEHLMDEVLLHGDPTSQSGAFEGWGLEMVRRPVEAAIRATLAMRAKEPLAQGDGLREAIEPILRFHETGGHEGDGSDEALAKARAALVRPIGDEVERLMNILVEAGRQESFADNTGSSKGQAAKYTEECKANLRAALVRSKLPEEMSLCSHAGTCEQNAVEHDGAFCVNPPIGDDVREAVELLTQEIDNMEMLDCDCGLTANQLREIRSAITAIGSQSIEGERG